MGEMWNRLYMLLASILLIVERMRFWMLIIDHKVSVLSNSLNFQFNTQFVTGIYLDTKTTTSHKKYSRHLSPNFEDNFNGIDT